MTFIDSRPIGIFDSGIGGLSITQYIKQHLPDENLIYMADTLHAPYGDKSATFITERVNVLCEYLLQRQVKAIVIACNTATVTTISLLRKKISIPIIGVEPAIKPASLYSKTKKIAVLVTQTTANNPRFLTLVGRFSQSASVYIQACPGLVDFIEQGKINHPQCIALMRHYLSPLLQNGVDTIVLGCTHYPFLLQQIRTMCGDHIEILDTAVPVTKELERQLHKYKLCNDSNDAPSMQFFSSKPSSLLDNVCSELLDQTISFNLF